MLVPQVFSEGGGCFFENFKKTACKKQLVETYLSHTTTIGSSPPLSPMALAKVSTAIANAVHK